MKSSSNIVSAIIDLKKADEHFQSFIRDNPGSKGAKLFKGYSDKINFIFKDLITNPNLTEPVRQGIKREIVSDVFVKDAITEKAALLEPAKKEMIELIIDKLLDGEDIEVCDKVS